MSGTDHHRRALALLLGVVLCASAPHSARAASAEDVSRAYQTLSFDVGRGATGPGYGCVLGRTDAAGNLQGLSFHVVSKRAATSARRLVASIGAAPFTTVRVVPKRWADARMRRIADTLRQRLAGTPGFLTLVGGYESGPRVPRFRCTPLTVVAYHEATPAQLDALRDQTSRYGDRVEVVVSPPGNARTTALP